MYKLLAVSDSEYAQFLHEEGYREAASAEKACKLFTFSGLRMQASRRQLNGDRLSISAGPLDWFISSPRDEFLLHSATGLLSAGSTVNISGANLDIASVEVLPTPEFGETTEFTCLSPIVAAVYREDRSTAYLRPTDPEFSDAVRANLLWKHRVLRGADPVECSLVMEFSPRYLADPKNRGGTKLVNFKGISMVGALAPFRLTGSKELMRVGYECGFGGKNGIGCGMAAVREQ